MATWRRCEKCRKVLSDDDFEPNASMCRGCAAKPARVARAGAVSTRRVVAAAPRSASATATPSGSSGSASGSGSMEPVDRPKREGVVGRGDPEVRGRRARTQALQELAALHAEDYDRLLQEARRAEGLT